MVVKRWDAYFKEFDEGKVIRKDSGITVAHYVGAPSMNAFCKSLSDGLNIINNKEFKKSVIQITA